MKLYGLPRDEERIVLVGIRLGEPDTSPTHSSKADRQICPGRTRRSCHAARDPGRDQREAQGANPPSLKIAPDKRKAS
jgi:hypothetical protein